MNNRILGLAILATSLFFFFESALSDMYYSNCVGVGSPGVSCLNNAYNLKSLVLYQGRWILGFFPWSIPDTMGRVSGVGFIGTGLSFFLMFRQKRKRLFASIASCTLVYMAWMILLERYFPGCIYYGCRITNYLPWISYSLGLDIISLVFLVSLIVYYLPTLMRLYGR